MHLQVRLHYEWDKGPSHKHNANPPWVLEVTGGKEQRNPKWLPYTLRPWFLGILSGTTLVLFLVVLLLFWFSGKNHGLGDDDGSSKILFGWRFTPSLVAVLYVQLTTMLLEDVKRTEPFARLSRPGGSSAKSTIFQAPMAWWTALASGLSKNADGRRSWLLVSSACLNIIGFLAISPLSSSFLEPRDVPITKDIQFARTAFKQNSPLHLHASRDTYLRTIGHILQDVSTSAWISDNYTVLPFWPSDSVTGSPPLGPLLSSSAQIWHAETQVFNTELECEPMSLLRRSINNVRYTAYNILNEPLDESGMIASIELSLEDGCVYGLAISTQVALLQSGGASWSEISKFITPPWPRTSLYSLTIDDSIPGTIYMNNSEECRDRELILFSTPWLAPSNTSYSANWTFSSDFRAAGQLCTTKYYTANITVHAQLSESSSEFSFDQDEYRSKRIPVPESFFNVTELQT